MHYILYLPRQYSDHEKCYVEDWPGYFQLEVKTRDMALRQMTAYSLLGLLVAVKTVLATDLTCLVDERK